MKGNFAKMAITDAYILKCLSEGKLRVDCIHGEIYNCKGKRYKQMINWAGYHYLNLKFFGKRYNTLVHRIVYLSWHKKIRANFVIDHINRNTHDNTLGNLRAVSFKKNCNNKRRSQTPPPAKSGNGMTKDRKEK